MYRTILVPLDGSAWSEQALPLACEIARRSAAAVHLVRVYIPLVEVRLGGSILADVPIVEESWNEERRQQELAELQARAQELSHTAGVQVSAHVLDGPVAATLADYIEESGADLVVLTTHGRGGLARVWLGSVVDALVRHVRTPLLVVRPQDGPAGEAAFSSPRSLMIPLDGSPWAEQVIEPAMDLGRLFGAECTLLQVVEPLRAHGYVPGGDMAELTAEATESLCSAARQYLESVAARLRAVDIPVTTRVILGSHAARAILNDAQAHTVDLLAMATHSRGGIARLFLGSVADKVLRGAEMPVLIIRPNGLDEQDAKPGDTVSQRG